MMNEKTFIFHWNDGSVDSGKGTSVSDAFMKLGFGAGAMGALDWWEVKDGSTQN